MSDAERDAYARAMDVLADAGQRLAGLPTSSVVTAALDFASGVIFDARGEAPTEAHLIQLTDRLSGAAAEYFAEPTKN